jgi:hypothetical protein
MRYLPAEINEEPVYLLCVGGPMEVVQDYLDKARELGIQEDRLLFFERVPGVCSGA